MKKINYIIIKHLIKNVTPILFAVLIILSASSCSNIQNTHDLNENSSKTNTSDKSNNNNQQTDKFPPTTPNTEDGIGSTENNTPETKPGETTPPVEDIPNIDFDSKPETEEDSDISYDTIINKPTVSTEKIEINESNLISTIKKFQYGQDKPKPFTNFNIVNDSFFIDPKSEKNTQTLYLQNKELKNEKAEWFIFINFPSEKLINVKNSTNNDSPITIIENQDKSITLTYNNSFINNHIESEYSGNIVAVIDNKYIHRIAFTILNDKKSELYRLKKLVNEKAKEATANMMQLSDVEKVFHINQYITDYITYDDGYYTLTSEEYFFLDQKAVCSGYSKMFMRLARDLGLKARYHSGWTLIEKHAWNSVFVDDGYYYVDTTWNDGNDNGNVYLFLPHELFQHDHEAYPDFHKISGKEHLYYAQKKFGMYASNTEEVHTLARIIKNKYDKSNGYVQFVAPSNISMNEIKDIFSSYNITYQNDYSKMKFNGRNNSITDANGQFIAVPTYFSNRKNLLRSEIRPALNKLEKPDVSKIKFTGQTYTGGIITTEYDDLEFNTGNGEWIKIKNGVAIVDKLFLRSTTAFNYNSNIPYSILFRRNNQTQANSDFVKIDIEQTNTTPTWISQNDSILSYISTNMEITEINDNNWKDISSTDLKIYINNNDLLHQNIELIKNNQIKLPSGEYLIRLKGEENKLASSPVKVIIN